MNPLELKAPNLEAALERHTQELAAHVATIKNLTQRLSVDGVISTETFLLDINGMWQIDSNDPVHSIAVTNLGSSKLTVACQPLGISAPQLGKGVIKVSAGQYVCTPLAGTSHSFYGYPGELVQVTRWKCPVPPSVGQIADQPYRIADFGGAAGIAYTTRWGDAAMYGGCSMRDVAGVAGTPDTAEVVILDTLTGDALDVINLAGRQSITDELSKGKLCRGPSISIAINKGTVAGVIFVR